VNNEQRAKLRYYSLPLLLITYYLLFSCTTAPKVPEQTPLEKGIVPLNAGAAAYALIDVPRARPILEGLSYIPANDKNVKLMLDKTRSAVVAVFSPSSADDRRYQLVAWGAYPASGSSLAFGANNNWTKHHSASMDMTYWHSEKAQMSVAVNPSQAYVLVAMTKPPHDPIPPPEGIKIPGGFAEFARDAVFSCWLSNPGPALNQKLKGMGLPLEIPAEQLFIRMFPADGQASAAQPASQPASPSEPKYEAHIKITLPSATQARTIASLLTMARSFMSSVPQSDEDKPGLQDTSEMLVSLLFANPVVQEESSLLFKLPPMSAREISLLFSMFSL
jgi:hypothetical protein